MNKAKIDQCMELGIQFARKLEASGLDSQKLQGPVDSYDHPFWTDVLVLGQKHFGMPLEEPKPTIIDWNGGELVIPTQPKFFVAEHFTKENTEVKFWDFGNNFKARYMTMTEKAVGETVVRVGKLKVRATLADMTPELGENRILTASQLFEFLKRQGKGEKPNGKDRRLLVDGSANLLRVLDKDGVEGAVDARWGEGDGWIVYAYVLENDDQWSAGYQVVSRK